MGFELLFILPLVLSITAIRRGWRGVVIDDHPLCRGCGFDLFGQRAGTSICSECGRDLSKPKAIVVGHRQKGRKTLGFGVTLLIVSAGWLGIAGYGRVKQVNWWQHAPLWYVLREASSGDAKRRLPAIAELSVRFRSNGFNPTQLDRVVDAGLKYQGDLSKPWDSAWGDLIEDVNDAGDLPEDRMRLYAKQAMGPLTLRVTPIVHPGESIAWHMEITPPRLAHYSNLWIALSWSPEIPDDSPLPGEFGLPGGSGGYRFYTKTTRHPLWADKSIDETISFSNRLLSGRHEVVIRVLRKCRCVKPDFEVDDRDNVAATFELTSTRPPIAVRDDAKRLP